MRLVMLLGFFAVSVPGIAEDFLMRTSDRSLHARSCDEAKAYMYATNRDFAILQGFTPHECVAPSIEPEATIHTDVPAERAALVMPRGWIDFYDWRIRKRVSSDVIYLGIAPGQMRSSSGDSVASSNTGDVAVRGHWRTTPDGGETWVDAHTRSRPGEGGAPTWVSGHTRSR